MKNYLYNKFYNFVISNLFKNTILEKGKSFAALLFRGKQGTIGLLKWI